MLLAQCWTTVLLFWAGDEGSTPMDAEARRRQLVAAINRVVGGDRAALRLVYSETLSEAIWRLSPYLG